MRNAKTIATRIVLANEPRLFREMLHRAINRAQGLEVVDEATHPANLKGIIAQGRVQCVVIPLEEGKEMADAVVSLLDSYRPACILAVSADGHRAKMHWLELHEEDLQGMTLDRLIEIIRIRSHWDKSASTDNLRRDFEIAKLSH